MPRSGVGAGGLARRGVPSSSRTGTPFGLPEAGARPLALDPRAAGPTWGGVGLSVRPVFLVTFTNGSKCVVKMENKGGAHDSKADAALSLKFGAELMGQINSKVGIETLAREELMALTALPKKNWKPDARPYDDFHSVVNDQYTPTPTEYIWVKMPFVERLKDGRRRSLVRTPTVAFFEERMSLGWHLSLSSSLADGPGLEDYERGALPLEDPIERASPPLEVHDEHAGDHGDESIVDARVAAPSRSTCAGS